MFSLSPSVFPTPTFGNREHERLYLLKFPSHLPTSDFVFEASINLFHKDSLPVLAIVLCWTSYCSHYLYYLLLIQFSVHAD